MSAVERLMTSSFVLAAILTLSAGCARNRGVRIVGASPEQSYEAQTVLDVLRSQTRGAVDRYLTDDDSAGTVVAFYPEPTWGEPRCGFTWDSGEHISIYPCGSEAGPATFGAVLMHELVHAEGVRGHTDEPPTRSLMAAHMSSDPDAPACLHQADFTILCAVVGCVSTRMAPCVDQ